MDNLVSFWDTGESHYLNKTENPDITSTGRET